MRALLPLLMLLMTPLAMSQKTWEADPLGFDDPRTSPAKRVHTSKPIQVILGANMWSSSGKNSPKLCTPGDTINIDAGDYLHFRFTHTYDIDGVIEPFTTVRGAGPGKTFILPNPVDGSQTVYLEWDGAKVLRDLTIIGDDMMAFTTENPGSDRWNGRHPGFRDIRLFNVEVDCGFDFENDKGPRNKWAIFGYEIGESAYDMPGWYEDQVHIHGVYHEHGHYFHNVQGDCSFTRGSVMGAGRTAFQFTGREGEGPQGKGNVYIADYVIEDVCIGDGGSAITIKGGHDGTFWLRNVVVKLGCNPDMHERFADHVTGCIVAHEGAQSYPAKPRLIVSGGRYVVGRSNVGKGSWRRPNLNISHLAFFELTGGVEVWSHPGAREALVMNLDTIDDYALCPSCDVRGDCVYVLDGVEHKFRDMDDGVWDGSAYREMRKELFPPGPVGLDKDGNRLSSWELER